MISPTAARADTMLADRALFLAVAVAAAVVCGWQVAENGVIWDEVKYAFFAERMAGGREGFFPAVLYGPADETYAQKPPFLFWLTAGAIRLFGSDLVSYRLASCLSGVALALLLYQVGRRWFGRFAGVVAVAVLFSEPTFLSFRGPWNGVLDLPAVMFGFAALAALPEERPERPWRRALLVGVLLGLVGFARPVQGLAVWALYLLAAHVRRDAAGPAWRAVLWRALPAMLVLNLAWPLALAAHDWPAFWDRFVMMNIVARAAGELYADHVRPWWFFWVELAKSPSVFAIYPVGLVFAAVWGWRRRGTAPGGRALACVAVAMGGMVGLSLPASKLPHYATLVYPYVALCLALVAARLVAQIRRRWATPIAAVAFSTAMLAPALVSVASNTRARLDDWSLAGRWGREVAAGGMLAVHHGYAVAPLPFPEAARTGRFRAMVTDYTPEFLAYEISLLAPYLRAVDRPTLERMTAAGCPMLLFVKSGAVPEATMAWLDALPGIKRPERSRWTLPTVVRVANAERSGVAALLAHCRGALGAGF